MTCHKMVLNIFMDIFKRNECKVFKNTVFGMHAYLADSDPVSENGNLGHLAIDSHNYRAIARAMSKFRPVDITPDQLVLELLTGVGDP